MSPSRPVEPGLGVRRSVHQIVVDGQVVTVPARHFAVLLVLVDAEGAVLTPRHLELQAGLHAGTDMPSLIRYLRRKLGPYGSWVGTVYGRGYYWANPSPEPAAAPAEDHAGWSLDPVARTLHTPSGHYRLSRTEVKILHELLTHTHANGAGALYPSQQLLLAIGADTASALTRAIATLRAKLGPEAAAIGNTHGRGYYLDLDLRSPGVAPPPQVDPASPEILK